MSGSQQQSQTGTSKSETNPWASQSGYLSQGFAAANNALTQANAAPGQTNFVAQLTPDQISTFQKMVGYGNGSNIPGQEASAGTNMLGAGVTGATGALSGYNQFDPTSANNLTAAINGGNTYAQGLDIPGQVQAAMRDATQTARDVTLPGMEANAAASGNINSSRTGVGEGIVQRGLAQQAGDLSATLRNNAYNTGAGLTSQIAQQNNADKLAALSGQGSLGAGAAGQGVDSLGRSINDQGALYGLSGQGGAGLQSGTQLSYDEQKAAHDYGVNSPFGGLNNFWNIVGSNNWGNSSTGTSTGQTTTTPSAWQVIGGLMGAAGSLGKGFAMPGFGGGGA